METIHDLLEDNKSVPTRLSLDDIFFDEDIYPRKEIDSFTLEKYCDDLLNGITFPHLKVERIGETLFRVIDGVHTLKAYERRREMYRLQKAGEHIGDPLPEISDEDLNTVQCVVEEIPEGVDPMLHRARCNRKNGKSLTSDDYRKVARHLYEKWFGAPVTKVASELGIRWETVNGYIADMVAEYNRQRSELILQLDAEGKTQEEISRLGREKYPHGTGWSQESISKFLAEHRKSATKGRKNGSRKVLNFRGSYKDPETVARERVVETLRIPESTEKEKKEKEGLETIECPDSFMVTGLNHLHKEIREPYLRVLAKLNDITWAKELRFREKLRKSENTVS